MGKRNPDNLSRSAGWTHCPPGRLSDLARAIRRRKQRRSFLKVAGTAAAVCAAGGISVLAAVLTQGERRPGGLTCRQVQELVPALQQGCLCASVRKQVVDHVAECSSCEALLRSRGLCLR